MKDLARAKERIADFKKSIARVITDIDHQNGLLQFECDEHGWSSEVTCVISEALQKFGVAMATLEQWWDNDEIEETK